MLSRLQEIGLIARCIASDDRDAFGQLVAAYADDIRRLLLGLTGGNVALVDDLAQETFLKAYLSVRSFKGVARFRTWLYRIAYNEFISHKRRQHDHLDIDNIPESATPAGDCGDCDFADTGQSLHRALEKLPENERLVTQLFYFDQFSISKISEITDMPPGTIKSYLHRARTKLAALLNKYENY